MDHRHLIEAVSYAAKSVVESGSYQRYSGAYGERLAADLGERLLASQVLLTCSGTAAMELALRAGGIVAGDEVLLSAYDYPGNFWAIERIGARPVLLDVEAEGWRIDAGGLQKIWEEAANYKALVVSHLHGQLQNIAHLRAKCDAAGLVLIEDACQALGATIADRPAGSFGHASIISFGGGKLLSSGRGGALLTSDSGLAQRAKIFSGGGSGPYALSELQAAVVGAQLPWLDEIVTTCREFFAAVAECLQTADRVATPFSECLSHTSFYQAGFLLPAAAADPTEEDPGNQQTETVARLLAEELPAGVGFSGFHRRSVRRCRHFQPLIHVADVAARTINVHHRAALTPAHSAEQIAHLLDGLRPQ